MSALMGLPVVILENSVEEIIFKEKVFQTRDGSFLFSVHQEMEQPGSTLNLYLRDGNKKDVVRLHLISDDGGRGQDPYLQIVALPMHPLGCVKIDSVSGNLTLCIQMAKKTSMFIASLPMFLNTQRSTSIEILNMTGSPQKAKIMSEKEAKSSQVLFQFSKDMESCIRIVILGAFLYLNSHLHEIRRLDNSSTNFQDLWIIDCVDWENRTETSSRPCDNHRRGEVSASKGGDCCGPCLAECRNGLCCIWDCLRCCSECCGCCLCYCLFLPCWV
ncbi:uncharacterized protein RB166_009595 [Leptodactylus fuscus]